MMESASTPGMSVNFYQTTWSYYLEDSHFQFFNFLFVLAVKLEVVNLLSGYSCSEHHSLDRILNAASSLFALSQ
jgi:hypothetical protein